MDNCYLVGLSCFAVGFIFGVWWVAAYTSSGRPTGHTIDRYREVSSRPKPPPTAPPPSMRSAGRPPSVYLCRSCGHYHPNWPQPWDNESEN